MAENPSVILSAFADEAANHKTAVEQFSALAALGLQYYCIRFIDAGGGVKNAIDLTRSEIQKVRHLQDEYGLKVMSSTQYFFPRSLVIAAGLYLPPKYTLYSPDQPSKVFWLPVTPFAASRAETIPPLALKPGCIRLVKAPS